MSARSHLPFFLFSTLAGACLLLRPHKTATWKLKRTHRLLWNIFTHVSGATTHKQIKIFPNQKPWMNREVRLRLKTRDNAFRFGDADSSSKANLKMPNRHTNYKLRNTSTALELVASGNASSTSWVSKDLTQLSQSLPSQLNLFYARFDSDYKTTAMKATPPPDDQALTPREMKVQYHEVCTAQPLWIYSKLHVYMRP